MPRDPWHVCAVEKMNSSRVTSATPTLAVTSAATSATTSTTISVEADHSAAPPPATINNGDADAFKTPLLPDADTFLRAFNERNNDNKNATSKSQLHAKQVVKTADELGSETPLLPDGDAFLRKLNEQRRNQQVNQTTSTGSPAPADDAESSDDKVERAMRVHDEQVEAVQTTTPNMYPPRPGVLMVTRKRESFVLIQSTLICTENICTKSTAATNEHDGMVIACGLADEVWQPSNCPPHTDCLRVPDSFFRLCCPF